MDVAQIPGTFPYREVALKLALSVGIGLLVGLEREWAHKEIGVRTFSLSALLGMLASLSSPPLLVIALIAVLVLVAFLNIHSLLKDRSLELTTSACLIIVFVLGALVGQGHNFTAASAAIAVLLLLSWKTELERFAGALRPEEIRGAVLLGLLSVVIYPLLPDRYIDAWQLVNPRQAWTIVVVLAAIGFVNYALMRVYRARGLYVGALLGGLVNSTGSAAQLAGLFRQASAVMVPMAAALLVLTNIAMFVRNSVILLIFARSALSAAALPLLGMASVSALLVWWNHKDGEGPAEQIQLSSPVSLMRVLRFGAVFLALSAIGTLAQRYLGSLGFLIVSVLGGLVSSASTTATAAALAASGKISPQTAGIGTVLTSMVSALVNLPLVYQQTRKWPLVRRYGIAMVITLAVGIALVALEYGLKAF